MIPVGARVWIALGHTDMRRGMQGLALLVERGLKRDPHGGDLFVFRGRSGQQATYCIWFSNGADRLSVASTVRSNPSHRAAPTRAGSAVHLH